MSWLLGWSSSAWPDSSTKEKIECDVLVDAKRAHVSTSPHVVEPDRVQLLSLPADVLSGLTLVILLNDTKGSRFARVSKACLELFLEASQACVRDGVAWWTGSGLPAQPLPMPHLPTDDVIENVRDTARKYVLGMQFDDVEGIKSGWLNNFCIDAILVASGCPILHPNASYVARPIDGTIVLSASLSSLADPSGDATPFSRTSFWGCPDVRKSMRLASCLIVPLHVNDNHWVAVRVAKSHSLVEVFDPLNAKVRSWKRSSLGACKSLQDLLQVLEACGVQGARGYRCIFHNSRRVWRQTDDHSCGIFTSVIIVSLSRGLRVHVLQEDMEAWRASLHRVVLTALVERL
jgi:hypothetical protein